MKLKGVSLEDLYPLVWLMTFRRKKDAGLDHAGRARIPGSPLGRQMSARSGALLLVRITLDSIHPRATCPF